jgi:hypothetical protein
MHDTFRRPQDRSERARVGDASAHDAKTVRRAELGFEIGRVPPLHRGRVGGVAEVVDDRDVIAAQNERARQVVADEADPTRDDPAHVRFSFFRGQISRARGPRRSRLGSKRQPV